MDNMTWRKSSYSSGNGGECIEVASLHDTVVVRDTKQDDTGPVLRFTPAAWCRFADQVKRSHTSISKLISLLAVNFSSLCHFPVPVRLAHAALICGGLAGELSVKSRSATRISASNSQTSLRNRMTASSMAASNMKRVENGSFVASSTWATRHRIVDNPRPMRTARQFFRSASP